MSSNQLVRVLFTGLAILFAPASAGATIIDFSSGSYAIAGAAQTYSESGFVFSTADGDHFDSNTFPGNTIVPGVPYLVFHESAANPVNNVITLEFGGLAFDFSSFDLIFDTPILAFNPIINPQMTVTASDGRSLITPLGAPPGFVGTVVADWLGITSVTFDIRLNSTAAGNVLMDNVVVEPATVQLPLPSAFALMLAGLVALGAFRMRLRRPGLGLVVRPYRVT